MVNNSQDYKSYTVTVPITLFIEASTPDKAVDVATEAILHSSNFNIIKNAEIDWQNAKVEEGHKFKVFYSK